MRRPCSTGPGVPNRRARRATPDAACLRPAPALRARPGPQGVLRGHRGAGPSPAASPRSPVAALSGPPSSRSRGIRSTPRPETEALVGAVLDGPVTRLLDLGTGTGCILLSILAERPRCHRARHRHLRGRARDCPPQCCAPSILPTVPPSPAPTGSTASTAPSTSSYRNPPYIAEAELPNLAPEVRDWEPRMALTPGGDGLDAYRAIAREAPARLAPQRPPDGGDRRGAGRGGHRTLAGGWTGGDSLPFRSRWPGPRRLR